MEVGIINDDTARSSAPVDYDKARHPLTIADAVELFAQLGTPRSKPMPPPRGRLFHRRLQRVTGSTITGCIHQPRQHQIGKPRVGCAERRHKPGVINQ